MAVTDGGSGIHTEPSPCVETVLHHSLVLEIHKWLRISFNLPTGLTRCLKTWPLFLFLLILTLQSIILNFLCPLSFSISLTSRPVYILFLCLSHICLPFCLLQTLHMCLCWDPSPAFRSPQQRSLSSCYPLLSSPTASKSPVIALIPFYRKYLIVSFHNCIMKSVKTGITPSSFPCSPSHPGKQSSREKFSGAQKILIDKGMDRWIEGWKLKKKKKTCYENIH